MVQHTSWATLSGQSTSYPAMIAGREHLTPYLNEVSVLVLGGELLQSHKSCERLLSQSHCDSARLAISDDMMKCNLALADLRD